MIEGRIEDFLDEIELCKKLYSHATENMELVKLMYKAKIEFEEDHHYLRNTFRTNITQADADESFSQSKPLLVDAMLNKEGFLKLLEDICYRIAINYPDMKEEINDFAAAIKVDLKGFEETVDAALIREKINDSYEEIGVHKDFSTSLLTFVLSTLFKLQLDDSIKAIGTKHWPLGSCPICGERPHYGSFRGGDGAKALECWQCGSQWIYPRVKCPYCKTTDQNKLGYFTIDDKDMCRVYTCNQCNKYYKVFDLREREVSTAFLNIHHLSTLSRDFLVAKEGFTPASGLHWVMEEELNL